MKNVMIVVPSLYGGGAERIASLWANELSKKKDYNVYLLTYFKMEKEYYINSSVNRLTLFNNETEYRKISFFRKVKLLRKVFVLNKIDYVIPFLFHTCIACSLANKVKVIHTVRNNPWLVPNSYFKRLLRDFFIKKDGIVIVQNIEQLKYFERNKYIKKYVIGNSINPECLLVTKDYSKINRRIISVGRLCEQKNYYLLIDSLKKVYDKSNISFKCDIYGDGPDKQKIENYIILNKMESIITLKGNVQNLYELEKEYDLFIMTSKYEGFPNALLEAMALGLPVISTNCLTGPRSLINDKINGFLINENSDELSDLIIELLDKDLSQVGRKAKEDVIMNYTQDKIVERIVKILEEN